MANWCSRPTSDSVVLNLSPESGLRQVTSHSNEAPQRGTHIGRGLSERMRRTKWRETVQWSLPRESHAQVIGRQPSEHWVVRFVIIAAGLQ